MPAPAMTVPAIRLAQYVPSTPQRNRHTNSRLSEIVSPNHANDNPANDQGRNTRRSVLRLKFTSKTKGTAKRATNIARRYSSVPNTVAAIQRLAKSRGTVPPKYTVREKARAEPNTTSPRLRFSAP